MYYFPRLPTPLRGVFAVAFLLVSASCSVNPVSGRPEFVLMSTQQEAEIGRQQSAQVAVELGLIAKQDLAGYASALGQRLAAFSPRRDVGYEFHVVDMPEPNAFALPGGYIYVSRGLLALVNNEAELANVIGHEIGHVAARHAAQRQTRATGVGLLTALATVLAGAKGGSDAAQAAAQIGQVAGAGLIASYSRDQEREADAIGQKLAAEAGYDPHAMSTFLDTLEKYAILHTGASSRAGYLASHPALSERVQTTGNRAGQLVITARPPIAERAGMLAKFHDLVIGNDPAQGVFREQLFLHPGLDFALRFPDGWRTANRRDSVAGQAADGQALITLHLQGPVGDPEQAAADFIRANDIEVGAAYELQIHGFRAYQVSGSATSQQGALGLLITWVAHTSGIMRITGVTPAANLDAQLATFRASAGSFRSLRGDERTGFRELRLRSASAREGESLQALVKRSSTQWSLEETAVVNALPASATLKAGQLIKTSISQPYRP